MRNFFKSLFGQVVVALVLGVVIGVVWPDFAVKLKPLGDGFIKLIKMVDRPARVLRGRAWHRRRRRPEEGRPRRRQGADLLRGRDHDRPRCSACMLAFVFQPGVGMNIDPQDARCQGAQRLHRARVEQADADTVEFLLKIIPTTVFDAFAKGDILQVLLFAVLFGARCRCSATRGQPLVDASSTTGAGAVQDHGLHRQAGAARRARRDRVHRRQVRHRLAQAARLAGRAVLRRRSSSSWSSCSARSCGSPVQHLQVPRAICARS